MTFRIFSSTPRNERIYLKLTTTWWPKNAAPAVALSAPANGASYTAPATVTLTATASDSDGTVAKVDFYDGATLLGTATAGPYTLVLSGVPAGNHILTALATDDQAGVTTSASVSIVVNPPPPPSNVPPTVSLTSPANGTHFTAPAAITITASAADQDGTITKVDFFAGSGPCLIAAEKLKRIGYAMEIEPMYCAVILERMVALGLRPKLACE